MSVIPAFLIGLVIGVIAGAGVLALAAVGPKRDAVSEAWHSGVEHGRRNP